MSRIIIARAFACAGLVVAGADTAAAQNAPVARTATLDEITVTARRREESLQDTPLSMTAFSAEQIQRGGLSNFSDVAKLTPGLVFDQDFGANDTRPSIRGLPATRGRPPVGILIDGIDVSSEAIATAGGGNLMNLRLLDLERIEVVKGPQSALYGRVAFGGAVNYITARPTETLKGRVNATIASLSRHRKGSAVNKKLGYTRDELEAVHEQVRPRTKRTGATHQLLVLLLLLQAVRCPLPARHCVVKVAQLQL